MGLFAMAGSSVKSLKSACLIKSLGLLVEYSLQEGILQMDVIKEHLLEFLLCVHQFKTTLYLLGWSMSLVMLDIFKSMGPGDERVRIFFSFYCWLCRVPHDEYEVE